MREAGQDGHRPLAYSPSRTMGFSHTHDEDTPMHARFRAFASYAVIAAAIALSSSSGLLAQTPGNLHHRGRWTPSQHWGHHPAIHLLLFPGTDATHHSRIYWLNRPGIPGDSFS